MPWHYGTNDQIICTAGCTDGLVACIVEHASQPANHDDDGQPYYRCPACDWIIPDLFGENNYDSAGTTTCPECEQGTRTDTYDGPCDRCNKRGRDAAERPYPAEVAEFMREHLGIRRTTLWACTRCMDKEIRKYTRALDQHRAAQAARNAETHAYHERHRGQPTGTCDRCGRRDYLDVADVEQDLFICVHCAATEPTQLDPAAEAGPPAGWYDDPEYEGYMRYWDGHSWVGPPTQPEYLENH